MITDHFKAFIFCYMHIFHDINSVPVTDAPEVSSEELESKFPVSLQTGSSTSLSLGLGSECDNRRKSGELLASSPKLLIGSSTSLFCGLGRARRKHLFNGFGKTEHFMESDFIRIFVISSRSMLSLSISVCELSSKETCVTLPQSSGV
jgi:hypothetical protein